jgi:hypothetical protein
VVTYKGQPVAGAEVAFLPVGDDATLSAASATTDANGRYALRTFFSAGDEVAGARPGEYRVTITKTELPPGELDPYKNPEIQRPKHLLPEKYADAKTSPERRTVEAKRNVFDFTLSD